MITYELKRASVRQLTIKVDEKGVHVKAPLFMQRNRIEAFIEKKASWIIAKQALFSESQQLDIVEGSMIQYLGKSYPLTITKTTSTRPKVIFNNESIHLHIETSDPAQRREAILRWYRKQAQTLFLERLDYWYDYLKPLHIPYPELHIRLMKTRFGVCNPSRKKVTLNLVLMLYRPELLDYVIVHELLHFVHADHSKNYYNLFSQWMPEWKTYREELQTIHFKYKNYLF